ncbi:LamG domain-containing protein [Burkholderia pyrrocinia]|uniref:LamG domain-containing protein n=1 Tax=Burkholderia pyrrocinia TaxID=60550 RepID=UPI00201B4A3C|nr:LamG domain-containing protein [Burkholderia pyrrocinia]
MAARLYLNGDLVGSESDVIFAPFRIGSAARNWIGRSQFAIDPHFDGMIDDFRVYCGALDDAQVQTLAQA